MIDIGAARQLGTRIRGAPLHCFRARMTRCAEERSLRSAFLLVVLALVLSLVTAVASASRDELRFGFGVRGKVTTGFEETARQDATAVALAVQPDQKILAVGAISPDWKSSSIALARYLKDGRLDTSFSEDGRLTVSIGRYARASDVVVQPDGRILVAGYGTVQDSFGEVQENFAVLRYLPNGDPDPTFAGDGQALTEIGSRSSYASSLALQPDGKIVVGGTTQYQDFALARYNPDGTLDTSFGEPGPIGREGTVVTDVGYPAGEGASDLVLAADGRVLAVGTGYHDHGSSVSQSATSVAAARYLADGSLDASFGNGGRLMLLDSQMDNAGAAAVRDDKILIVGESANRAALTRLRHDGTVDPGFGSRGIVRGRSKTDAGDLVELPDGGFLLAGAARGGTSGGDMMLMVITADGRRDRSYARNGIAVVDFDDENDRASGIALQRKGRPILAGSAEDRSLRDRFALAGFRAP